MPQELLRQQYKEETKTRKPIRLKLYGRILNRLHGRVVDEAKGIGEYEELIKLMDIKKLFTEADMIEDILINEIEHYKIIQEIIDQLEK
jgi:hypothetical protein